MGVGHFYRGHICVDLVISTSKIASLTVEYRYELYLLDSLSKIKQSKLLNFKICQKSHVFLQYCQI